MGHLSSNEGAIDYAMCRYGQSRLMFRGPPRVPEGGYCVALGGAATFGRYLPSPWPHLLERISRRMVINLGVPHAGPDAYLSDPCVMRLVIGADLRLIEVPDAINLSNPLYSVHSRRNDRFLRAGNALVRLYPEVDFTEFAFTRHMIGALAEHGQQRFALVARQLQQVWLARMGQLLDLCDGPTVLVWLADRPPPEREVEVPSPAAPRLVNRAMLEALRPRTSEIVEVVVGDYFGGVMGKIFGPTEEPAARASPGREVHEETALGLMPFVVGGGAGRI